MTDDHAAGPPCPVCGNGSWYPVMQARDMHGTQWFPITGCGACGLRRTADRLAPEDLGRYYDYPGGRDAGQRFVGVIESVERALRRRRARAVQRLRSRPGRILDVGCGRGIMLAVLARSGWDAWGTEIDAQVAATARQTLGERVATGDFLTADLGPGRFDVVTFFHALEHLVAPRESLERAASLLQPGGHVIVELPDWASWQARWFGRHWLHLDVPRHRYHFTRELLVRMAADFGLTCRTVQHFSLEYGPYSMLQSTLAASGLDHVLFTRLLRPAGEGARPRSAMLLHLLLSPLLAAGLGVATAVELLAAAAGHGAVVRVTLQAQAGGPRA